MAFDLRARLFARFYDRMMGEYERHFAADKQKLFAELAGDGLEIGPGTGANLPLLSSAVRLTGVEPNRHMHGPLRAQADALGLEVSLVELAGERLPFEDASFDFALSTLVLCTVPDPTQVLAEVRRVLRPGGRFVFWEHVAAPRGTWTHRIQRVLTPLWRVAACGCHLNRDLAARIRAAGFTDVELEDFRAPPPVIPPFIAPHIRGTATR